MTPELLADYIIAIGMALAQLLVLLLAMGVLVYLMFYGD